MVGARVERREEDEQQVDRAPVNRLEINRPRELEEQAAHPGKVGKLGMGQGDAAPESRRAEPFAFEQCFGHLARIETERARRQVADIRKERLFRIDRRSEEHTSELQSLMRISYAVFCLKKKTTNHSSTVTTPKDNQH